MTVMAAGPVAPPTEQVAPPPGQFGVGAVLRPRREGRRRPVGAAAVVSGDTMAGIIA
ncbi:hypothetical protein [Streptomyces sp. NPDC006132]|uniref:hypothetical protein n=1 Tax=Streptomyces sp. NPDC006132 TaxID=3156732 RepID=UPI0033DAD469